MTSPKESHCFFMYFQLRCFPAEIHSTAVATRAARVAVVFASVIHSAYSRFALGLNAAYAASAFFFFASAAPRSLGVLSAVFGGRSRLGGAFAPCSLSFMACFTYPI